MTTGLPVLAPGAKRHRRMLGLAKLASVAVALSAGLPATGGAQPLHLAGPHSPRASFVTRIAVFDTDDRVPVPSRFSGVAERIGLLFNSQSRTVCTAFCVAGNVIATAAHCMGRGQTNGAVRFSEYTFARNYDRVRDLVHIEGAARGAAAQHVLSGDFRLKVKPPIDAAFDWALVRVPQNTCPARSLDVVAMTHDEIMAEAKAGHVFQVAYHRDFAQWKPAYSKPCAVSRDYDTAKWPSISPDFIAAEHMILHTCDTGGASSGSPLLLDTTNGPVVIGINVGTYVQSRVTTENGKPTSQSSETVANTAVNAVAFADQIELLKGADIIAAKDAIRDLQERLRAQSLYQGRIDGSYGPQLKAAIEAYEQSSRLPVTGLPTAPLASRLAQDAQRRGQIAPSSLEHPGAR